MNRAQLKEMAKSQIKGNIGILFVIVLLIGLIGSAVGAIPVVGAIAAALVVTPAFSLAVIQIYLGLTQGRKPEISDMFSEFKNFWPAFKVNFLVGLFTGLWSLLFFIPGLIKMISYSMSMYILAENPELGALEAISRSKKMMHGYKMEFFVLSLSFIGWMLLGVITFGIAYIYVLPYMQATLANFYNSIKSNGAVVENPVEF